MFGNRKKTIDDMTTEEIEKYLESRKASEEKEQSLKDRVDESVAEQEKADGDEKEQDAKDRVDEALGEDEELEEEGEEETESAEEDEEGDETEDDSEEEVEGETEDKSETLDLLKKYIDEKFEDLQAQISALAKQPKEVEKTTADRLSELERKYNN